MSEKRFRRLKNEDEDGKLKVENRSLKLKIKDLIKEIVNLKSQLKTVEAVWDKTELYLRDQTGDQDLLDLINKASKNNPTQSSHKCSKCSSKEVSVRTYRDFKTFKCNVCNFLKKVDNK